MGKKDTSVPIDSGRIREQIRKKGYNIASLAREINYSRETLTKAINAGKMDFHLLDVISKKLNVTPDYLRGIDQLFGGGFVDPMARFMTIGELSKDPEKLEAFLNDDTDENGNRIPAYTEHKWQQFADGRREEILKIINDSLAVLISPDLKEKLILHHDINGLADMIENTIDNYCYILQRGADIQKNIDSQDHTGE